MAEPAKMPVAIKVINMVVKTIFFMLVSFYMLLNSCSYCLFSSTFANTVAALSPSTFPTRSVKTAIKSRICPNRFKNKVKGSKCPKCNQIIERHEEKATDVNLALYLYKLAHLNEYDKVYLVTGDTDLVPAINMVKEIFPDKIIRMLDPYNRFNQELATASDGHSLTKIKHLDLCRLPDEVERKNKKPFTCPIEWQIK